MVLTERQTCDDHNPSQSYPLGFTRNTRVTMSQFGWSSEPRCTPKRVSFLAKPSSRVPLSPKSTFVLIGFKIWVPMLVPILFDDTIRHVMIHVRVVVVSYHWMGPFQLTIIWESPNNRCCGGCCSSQASDPEAWNPGWDNIYSFNMFNGSLSQTLGPSIDMIYIYNIYIYDIYIYMIYIYIWYIYIWYIYIWYICRRQFWIMLIGKSW